MSGSRAERLRMYHRYWKKKTWNHAKERKKPEYSRVSAISQWLLWRKSWKEKRKKVKIFAYIFAYLGFYDDFWLWSRDIQFWRTLVFLAPACVKYFRMSISILEAGGQEEVHKKGRKKEIIEDKKGYQFGIIILIT